MNYWLANKNVVVLNAKRLTCGQAFCNNICS
jgi:hypothetical protein